MEINAICKFKETSLDGKARIQALFDELERNFRCEKVRLYFFHSPDGEGPIKYSNRYKLSARGHLEQVFFAHPYTYRMRIDIWMLSSLTALIKLDCTYQANAFNMPFLHIVGINSLY